MLGDSSRATSLPGCADSGGRCRPQDRTCLERWSKEGSLSFRTRFKPRQSLRRLFKQVCSGKCRIGMKTCAVRSNSPQTAEDRNAAVRQGNGS